jgi:hypothetical protein
MKKVEIDGTLVAKVEKKLNEKLEEELNSLRVELRKQEAEKDRLHKAGMKVEQPERAEIFQQAVPYCRAVSKLRKDIMRVEKALRGD